MDPLKTDLVVVGGGPGGYTAAFYASDKGKRVILVEQEKSLGGVCLHKGCIPSKALLHAARAITEARESKARGIVFPAPKIHLDKVRAWKDSVVDRLAQGLKSLSRERGVEVMTGRGYFENSALLRVETEEGQKFIQFENAIIAVGSRPVLPRDFDLGNPRIMTSTEALELKTIPRDFLIVGGGYIGMELGTVYAALGSRIVLAEAMESILIGVDPDLARPVMRYAEQAFREVRLGAKVLKMATQKNKIRVTMELKAGNREAGSGKRDELYDRVLVSVGRVPDCDDVGLENTKVERDDNGFIRVDDGQRTSDPAIFAIGDAARGPLLAHKASKEARVAVNVIAGGEGTFQNIVMPAVVYTDPEVAWCGLTESEARKEGIPVEVMRVPWAASGRALTLGRPDGLTKLILEPDTGRVLGVGISGVGAGELISEGVLAVEMGATARELAEVVHPHPTLSETLMEGAEGFYGFATHSARRRR
ncbi:MAG: dihydrolipoyl dehydrogenase [Candidatus Omnitrophica bacterium]|nr:dihydrolipoyl dehydrogenase [Candidatus Omnitrophota bacterium]